jgi:hypothetical protein
MAGRAGRPWSEPAVLPRATRSTSTELLRVLARSRVRTPGLARLPGQQAHQRLVDRASGRLPGGASADWRRRRTRILFWRAGLPQVDLLKRPNGALPGRSAAGCRKPRLAVVSVAQNDHGHRSFDHGQVAQTLGRVLRTDQDVRGGTLTPSRSRGARRMIQPMSSQPRRGRGLLPLDRRPGTCATREPWRDGGLAGVARDPGRTP